VRNRRSSFFLLALLLPLPPLVAHAQDEAAAAAPAADQPADQPAPPALTVESLRAELQAMQARHAQQAQELRAELTRREEQAALEHERESMQRERLLRIYGFADTGMLYTVPPEDALLASQFTLPLSFYFGHLNLYYDSHPAPDFRFLAETRLSLYPHGASAVGNTGQVLRTSTTVSDISSPNPSAQVNWGGIILERAVLDWTRYPFFSVRAGLFLTPFGVYNVDHGTPTLIAASLPIYIGQNWIPERQLGLEVFGSHPVERWELGYNATVSNGRTDGILDVGDSKAFGGRLFARRQGELRLLLGASALYQPYRRNLEQFGMDASGNLTYTSTRVVEKTMLTLGNDISVDFRGLRVRNEIVFFQARYTPGKRDAPAQAQGGLDPDSRQYNWSLIVAYRIWDLEPYVRLEFFYCSPTQAIAQTVLSPGLGMNLYLRPTVILKANWTNPHFYRDNDPQNLAARQNFNEFIGILTWAF
jgi:hypothetical protein